MSSQNIKQRPLYSTYAQKSLRGGMVRGTNGSVWLWRSVPMGSIVEAKTTKEALNVSAPLALAMRELSNLVTTRGVSRGLAKKKYREFHLLMTNYPRPYEAPERHPLRSQLNRWYRDLEVLDRRLLLGVRLVPTTGDGTVKGFLDSAEQTLFGGGGTLLSDYDKDFAQVSAAMNRAGLGMPTADDLRSADSWWNFGDTRDVAEVRHTDHIHMFTTTAAWKEAERMGLEECEPWHDMSDHRAITFATLANFDLGYTPVTDPNTWWAYDLMNMDARMVSVRGFVEPPIITKQELESQKRRMRADLEEGYSKGRDQARREEREAEVHSIQSQYDMGKDAMPPTIQDMSVVVGFAGMFDGADTVRVGSAELHVMSNRQLAAWHESMICSPVRANPRLHDVPATTLAYSGITNLTCVGDDDGAMLGITQDRQPVYLSANAASRGDAAPLVLGAAATGAGKTVLLQSIAMQHGLAGSPTIVIDPKERSELHWAFQHIPGFTKRSFDDFISSDGGLDPLTLYATPEEGIPLAADMLFNVNPWGDDRRRVYEAEIANAIRYGVAHGAKVTGQALAIAFHAGQVRREVVEDVFRVAQTFPKFRATFGLNPPEPGAFTLATSNSVTLFMRGNSPLTLPPQGRDIAMEEMSAEMRQSVNLLRMLVRGSMIALTGRGGVLHMDEAWVLERAVPDELNEVGRLARSMNVLPIFYTQTPTGPLRLGLKGYFSRGLIGHIADETEAAAGLELFHANREGTLDRVTARESLSGGHGANWSSLKALYTPRNPETGKRDLLRGSVFYYGDLKERFAATTILLPDGFLEVASTNPEDVAARTATPAAMRFFAD